jgi:hypothetical protein
LHQSFRNKKAPLGSLRQGFFFAALQKIARVTDPTANLASFMIPRDTLRGSRLRARFSFFGSWRNEARPELFGAVQVDQLISRWYP